MRIAGKKIEGPSALYLVIPRQTGDIVFTATPVLDYSDFNKLCKRPEPPLITTPGAGGGSKLALKDPKFLEAINDWSSKHTAYMIIKSLGADGGLEWDTVDIGDPSTYLNYSTEFEQNGFSEMEVLKLTNLVFEACGLDQSKIDEATASFLAERQEALLKDSSQKAVLPSTLPGQPVKDSE